jgi:succinate-acetate transporter protein
MTLLTIYALFFDDIRVLAFPKEKDDVFYGITLMGIIIFTLEIFFASFVNPAYIGSFFFYLDIVSTLTMIPDCGWIWTQLIENG